MSSIQFTGTNKGSGQNAYRLASWNLLASPEVWMTSTVRATKHERQMPEGSTRERERKDDYGGREFPKPRLTKHRVFVGHG